MICIQQYPVTLSAIVTKVRDRVFFLIVKESHNLVGHSRIM